MIHLKTVWVETGGSWIKREIDEIKDGIFLSPEYPAMIMGENNNNNA